MKKHFFILFFILFPIFQVAAQENKSVNPESSNSKPFLKEGFVFDYLKISGLGLGATGNELPFWFYRNTNDRIGARTNVQGLVQGSISYYLSEKSYIELGGGVVASDDYKDNLRRDELYLSFINSWLKITLGSQTPFQKYQGLSVVGDNFLKSGNSRALPGLIIEASDPLKLSKTFEIDWGIAHYSLNDSRHVDNTRVHYKRLGFIINLNVRSSLKGGMEHYAQWAGTSPVHGKLAASFQDFIHVFLAKYGQEGTVLGEELNSVGNHLGLYNLEYHFNSSSGRFVFYHQHPFEDGSGSGLQNFPDGIWGFYFGPNTVDYDSFVTGFIIEYVQTTDQSGNGLSASGGDNYFNNRVYRSGWTYHNRVIGLPFIILNENGLQFDNTRTRAIHIGLSASHKQWAFKTKISFVENLGTYFNAFMPAENAIYTFLNTGYSFEKYGELSLLLGFDYSDKKKDSFGAGLSYSYSF